MKILVISLAGIGDTLLATPLIHELRANFPDATIDALVLWAGSKDLLENNPHLNRVYQKNLIEGRQTGGAAISSGRCGASVTTFPSTHIRRAGCITASPRASSARQCASATNMNVSAALDRWLVNQTLPQDYTRHSIENNFDALPLLGAKKKLLVARN